MEDEYNNFQHGEFGMECMEDWEKEEMKRHKAALRRRITTDPDNFWRIIYYLRHKRRLEEIEKPEPVIKEAQIPTSNPVNKGTSQFNRAQALQAKIDRNNALLLADIHKIYSQHNEVKNPYMEYMVNRNWKHRLHKTLRIGMENCAIYNRLQQIKPVVPSRVDYSKWYREMTRFRILGSKYPPFGTARQCAPFEEVGWQRATEVPKPIVYLDFEVEDKAVGRVAFELYAEKVPMTAENFRSLCVGDRGRSYKCTTISLILNGLLWQGGDGITSVYGEPFPIENYRVKHDSEGILSMVNYGEKTQNSEFRISGTALPPMNNKQVAFGKVIMGMSYLREMTKLAGVNEHGKPKISIIITGGGETTEDELMDLKPPMTLKEQRHPPGAEVYKKKEHKSSKDRGIPVRRSYGDHRTGSKGKARESQEEEELKPSSSKPKPSSSSSSNR